MRIFPGNLPLGIRSKDIRKINSSGFRALHSRRMKRITLTTVILIIATSPRITIKGISLVAAIIAKACGAKMSSSVRKEIKEIKHLEIKIMPPWCHCRMDKSASSSKKSSENNCPK